MHRRVGSPVRLALVLAALVALLGVAAPVAHAAHLPGPGHAPSAATAPYDAPDLTLSDLLHARPITTAVPATAAAQAAAPPAVAATLFALAALLFVALRELLPVAAVRGRPFTPRRGRSPPTVPN